jgi:hypothetical protein
MFSDADPNGSVALTLGARFGGVQVDVARLAAIVKRHVGDARSLRLEECRSDMNGCSVGDCGHSISFDVQSVHDARLHQIVEFDIDQFT